MDGNRPVQYGLRASNEFGIAVKCVQRGLNVCSCICAYGSLMLNPWVLVCASACVYVCACA